MISETQGQEKKIVGVEASDSAFSAVCLDSRGNVTASHETPLVPGEDKLQQMIVFLRDLKSVFGEFENVGIAIPGLIHSETRRVAYSAHIPEHSRVDLILEIKSETGIPSIIENDANAAAYAEFKLGAGRESRDMFYATLGSGVGGAFIIDGKIWRGASGFAGEFGYITINSDGMRLEDVASAENIVRRTRNRFHQDNTSSLSKLSEQQITIADIVRAAEREDDFAQMMLSRTGMYVGTAVASVINLLNIETVVVGGEVMDTRGRVLDAIIRRAQEFSFAPSFQSTRIVAGELGKHASAIGAALLSDEAVTSG
jgi:glucokinase